MTGEAPQPGETPRHESNPWSFSDPDRGWWRGETDRPAEGATAEDADRPRHPRRRAPRHGQAAAGSTGTLEPPAVTERTAEAAEAHDAGTRDAARHLAPGTEPPIVERHHDHADPHRYDPLKPPAGHVARHSAAAQDDTRNASVDTLTEHAPAEPGQAPEALATAPAQPRPGDQPQGEPGPSNLSAADLSAGDLSAADLSVGDLSAADLSAADLSAADLSAADLSAADLSAGDLKPGEAQPDELAPRDLKPAEEQPGEADRGEISPDKSGIDEAPTDQAASGEAGDGTAGDGAPAELALEPDVMVLPEPTARNRPTVPLERGPLPGVARQTRRPHLPGEPLPRPTGSPRTDARLERLENSPFWDTSHEHLTEPAQPSRYAHAGGRRGTRRASRGPAPALLALITLGLVAAFFAWVSAEPFWLALGHGDRGYATTTHCTGSGVTQRCAGRFAAADGGYTVARVTLLGVGPAARVPGTVMPARMVSADSRRAYLGEPGPLLQLRWLLGFILVLFCGYTIAGVTGARRLETARARRGAVLLSLAGPVLLLAGFLIAAY